MQIPSYVTEAYFRALINKAYTYYMENDGRKPIATDLMPPHPSLVDVPIQTNGSNHDGAVAELSQYSTPFGDIPQFNIGQLTIDQKQDKLEKEKSLIEKIMKSPEWATAMSQRGIKWQETDGLTSEQHYALAVLSDPTDRRSLERKLDALGLTYNQYRAWLRDPNFNRAVTTLSEQMLRDAMGSTHLALVRQIEKGDINAIKYYYELTGRHDPNRRQVLDIMTVLGQVIEIIQRHVKDPAALEGIAQDVGMLTMPFTMGSIEGQVISGNYNL